MRQPNMGTLPKMSNVTIGITSFERPDALARLLASINPATRGRPVIVVDNSRVSPVEVCLQHGAKLVALPFDSGLAACRNALMREATTPYVLLCEDDFIFTPATRIDWLVQTMRELRPVGVNLVSGSIVNTVGSVYNTGNNPGWLHGMYRHNRTLLLASGPTGEELGFPTADLTINFFLIRREAALRHPWREELKQGEHLAWFWEGKQNGLLSIAHRADVQILHQHVKNAFYDQHRDRLKDYRQQWLLANGFDKVQHVRG